MANAIAEQNFKELLDGIGRKLKAQGFIKRGNAFRRVASGNSAIIELQRSQSSTASRTVSASECSASWKAV